MTMLALRVSLLINAYFNRKLFLQVNQKSNKGIEVSRSYLFLIFLGQSYINLSKVLNFKIDTSESIFQLYTLAAGVFEFLIDDKILSLIVASLYFANCVSSFEIKNPEIRESEVFKSNQNVPLDLQRKFAGKTYKAVSHLYNSKESYQLDIIITIVSTYERQIICMKLIF